MNAYAPYMEALPMPLTDVDQSTFAWFKFSHIEFLMHPKVAMLKLIEQGALIRLMAYAARQVPFASLPDEPDLLAAMVGLSLPRWAKMADQVLGAGFELCRDGRYYCALMVDELTPVSQQHGDMDDRPAKPVSKKSVDPELSKKRSDAAAKSHASRKAKQQNDDANLQNDDAKIANGANLQNLQHAKVANALQNGGIKGGDLDLDSDLDLNKDQSVKSTCAASQHATDAIAQKFDQFWSVYPRKTDRKKARAAFERIKPSDDLLQTMLSAINAWSAKWTAEPQYIPHPTTWLNGERWNDEPPVMAKASTAHPTTKPLNPHSQIREDRAAIMRAALDEPSPLKDIMAEARS